MMSKYLFFPIFIITTLIAHIRIFGSEGVLDSINDYSILRGMINPIYKEFHDKDFPYEHVKFYAKRARDLLHGHEARIEKYEQYEKKINPIYEEFHDKDFPYEHVKFYARRARDLLHGHEVRIEKYKQYEEKIKDLERRVKELEDDNS